MKTDLAIIEEVKSGDHQAFSELVRRHQKALLRLCLRFTKSPDVAEDIVQDAFLKAYRKLDMFEGRSAFKSWLYTIAVNTAKNKLRSKRDLISFDKITIAVGSVAETNMIKTNIQDLLKVEVQKLPDKQRQALELRIYEDLSFKEIAVIMCCPYDTAKANYRHGLMKIKSTVKQKELLSHYTDSGLPMFEMGTTGG